MALVSYGTSLRSRTSPGPLTNYYLLHCEMTWRSTYICSKGFLAWQTSGQLGSLWEIIRRNLSFKCSFTILLDSRLLPILHLPRLSRLLLAVDSHFTSSPPLPSSSHSLYKAVAHPSPQLSAAPVPLLPPSFPASLCLLPDLSCLLSSFLHVSRVPRRPSASHPAPPTIFLQLSSHSPESASASIIQTQIE